MNFEIVFYKYNNINKIRITDLNQGNDYAFEIQKDKISNYYYIILDGMYPFDAPSYNVALNIVNFLTINNYVNIKINKTNLKDKSYYYILYLTSTLLLRLL